MLKKDTTQSPYCSHQKKKIPLTKTKCGKLLPMLLDTGETDEDGNSVFNGDIVRFQNETNNTISDDYYVVVFQRGKYILTYMKAFFSYGINQLAEKEYIICCEFGKVVGNVYE